MARRTFVALSQHMFGDFSYHCSFIDYLNKHYSLSLSLAVSVLLNGEIEFEHCLHSVRDSPATSINIDK